MKVILVGRTGTEKARLVKDMQDIFDLTDVIQITTSYDQSGYYNQVTREEFNTLELAGHFIDTKEFNGELYGTRELPTNSISIITPESALWLRSKYEEGHAKIIYLERDCVSPHSPSDDSLAKYYKKLDADKNVVKISGYKTYEESKKLFSDELVKLGYKISFKNVLKRLSSRVDLTDPEVADFLIRYYEESLLYTASRHPVAEDYHKLSTEALELDAWIEQEMFSDGAKGNKIEKINEMRNNFSEELKRFRRESYATES